VSKVGRRQNAVDSSQHTEDRKQNDQKRLSLAEALRTQRVEVKDSMLKTEVRATERERSEVRDQ